MASVVNDDNYNDDNEDVNVCLFLVCTMFLHLLYIYCCLCFDAGFRYQPNSDNCSLNSEKWYQISVSVWAVACWSTT